MKATVIHSSISPYPSRFSQFRQKLENLLESLPSIEVASPKAMSRPIPKGARRLVIGCNVITIPPKR